MSFHDGHLWVPPEDRDSKTEKPDPGSAGEQEIAGSNPASRTTSPQTPADYPPIAPAGGKKRRKPVSRKATVTYSSRP